MLQIYEIYHVRVVYVLLTTMLFTAYGFLIYPRQSSSPLPGVVIIGITYGQLTLVSVVIAPEGSI